MAIKEQLIIEGKNRTQRALGQVQKDLRGINRAGASVSAGFSRMQTLILGVATAFGVFKTAGNFLGVARGLENLQFQLAALTGSTEEAAKAMDILQDFAGTVPFALQDIQSAAPSLLAVAEDTEELNELLAITGDIAAASGLDFQTVALQLQRTFSGGIGAADLFRDRAVKSMLGFQEGVQYSASQSRDHILKVFRDGTVSIAGESAKMAETFDGALSMIGDKFFTFQKIVMDEGPFDFLKGVIQVFESEVAENFDAVKDAAGNIGEAITRTARRAIIGGARLIDALKPVFEIVRSGFNGLIRFTDGLPATIKALGLVGFLMLGTKGKLVAVTIGLVIDNISAMFGKLLEIVSSTSRKIAGGASALGFDTMAANLRKFADDVDGSIDSLKVKVDSFVDDFSGNVTLNTMEALGLPGPETMGEYERFVLNYLAKVDAKIKEAQNAANNKTLSEIEKQNKKEEILALQKQKKQVIAARNQLQEEMKKRVDILKLEADFLFEGTKQIEDQYKQRTIIIQKALEEGLINAERAAELEVALNKRKLRDIEEATKESLKNRRIEELRQAGKTEEQAKSIVDFENKSATDKAEFAISKGRETFEALGKMNRDAFRAYKAFAIAEAIVSTYKGAAKALGSYPPPFNFIAAAAVVAGGLAQVNAIRSQNFSGRKDGGAVGAGQSYIVGERQAEIFRAPPGGGFIDNGTSSMGKDVTVNFTVNAIDSNSFQETLNDQRDTIVGIVNEAVMDKGRPAIA